MAPSGGTAWPVDVLVVGGGPAGAMTARILARAGYDVLIIDRAAFPRPKPCGDCLSAAATDLLERQGLLHAVLEAGASRLSRWEILAPDGTRAVGRFGGATALALERERLDPVLLEAAREAGAGFLQARVTDLLFRDGRVTGVRARTSEGREIRAMAPLVVGADGLRSIVSRRLGLIRRAPRLRKVSLTAHVPAPPGGLHHGEMHVLDGGCIGFAPAGEGRCNVTLVVAGHRAADLPAVGGPAFFRQWLRRAPALHNRLGDVDHGPLLASGPFDWPTHSAVASGAALVGDAAGYYDPFTGQGIYQAMAGAELLAEAVVPSIRERPERLAASLQSYARAQRRLSRPSRRAQRAIEWILSGPGRATFALERLARAPTAMDRVVDVTGDLRPPRSLLSPAVLSSFLFPRTSEVP